jgi:phage gp36-like protein
MDPATLPLRRDLNPYISHESIVLALADISTGYPDQQTIVDQLITEGEEMGHSYCRRHYKIPLDTADPQTDPPTTPPTEFLQAIGKVIAYKFWTRGGSVATEAARQEYDLVIQWLRDVAARKVRIDSELLEPTANAGGYLITSARTRQITPETMGIELEST